MHGSSCAPEKGRGLLRKKGGMETYVYIPNDEVNSSSTKYQMFFIIIWNQMMEFLQGMVLVVLIVLALLNKHDVEIIGLETLLVIMKRGMI